LTVKYGAITDFVNNLAAAISDAEWFWAAVTGFLKKTYKKDLTNSEN